MSTPDFTAIARELGLVYAVYPLTEAFRHLGIRKSFGFELIKRGDLPTVTIADKKVVVKGVDIARLIWEREHRPAPKRSRGRPPKSESKERETLERRAAVKRSNEANCEEAN
jgi:hypothetical protein